MDLQKVEPKDIEPILRSTLNTLFSQEETIELIEGLILELEEGSQLFAISEGGNNFGFLILTPLSDETEKLIDLVSVEDIFIQPNRQNKETADSLSKNLKSLGGVHNTDQIEIIISQSNAWLAESLVENGFISSEVKLEKLLPRSNNLEDVLELIQDCTPIDRIVQVLLEKDEEFRAEVVDSSDEITDLLDDNWEPVMVVVTYEPDTSSIEEQIEKSNQLLNWDDYSIVYNT